MKHDWNDYSKFTFAHTVSFNWLTIKHNIQWKQTCFGWPLRPPMVVAIMWPVSVPFPSTTVASSSCKVQKITRFELHNFEHKTVRETCKHSMWPSLNANQMSHISSTHSKHIQEAIAWEKTRNKARFKPTQHSYQQHLLVALASVA